MTQIHKRLTNDQVKVLLQGYCQGLLARAEIQEILGIGKSRFFALLKEYRKDPEAFSIAYERHTPGRLSANIEAEIESELLREQEIVENKELPISGYNYSALRDRLKKGGIKVSVTTIIDRAKRLDCYKPRKKRKFHDREVLTVSVGALVQHDSSLHLWSPFAQEKWVLITSIDDFSRELLFADFVQKDTTWAHRGIAFSTYAGVAIERQVWRVVARACRPQGWMPLPALVDPRQLAEENLWFCEVYAALREAVSRLPERLRQVIVAAYGLDGESPRTLMTIGQQFGVSREMARIWRNDGLLLLRLSALSERLRHLCDQDSRAAYLRTQALNRARLRQKRGPTPSKADVQVTKGLVSAGSVLDVEVLDHLIVGREGYVSMRERRKSLRLGPHFRDRDNVLGRAAS